MFIGDNIGAELYPTCASTFVAIVAMSLRIFSFSVARSSIFLIGRWSAPQPYRRLY